MAARGPLRSQGDGLLAPSARLQTPDCGGFSLDDSAMDELNRFRNAVLAVAATTVAYWLINDWVHTLEILTDPSLWLQNFMAPRPD